MPVDIQWYREQPLSLTAAFHFTPELALQVLMGEETLPWGLQVEGKWDPETRTLHVAWIRRGFSPVWRPGTIIFQDAEGRIHATEPHVFLTRYRQIEKSEDF